MPSPVYDPATYKILPLVQNEQQGQLKKIASFYNASNLLFQEFKTFPETEVGAACLKRIFFYNAFKQEIGRSISIDTWTQAMEDLALTGTGADPAYPNDLSLSFNGIDKYVDFGDVHKFDIATAFTISLWVNPQNLAASRILFSKAGAGPGVHGYMLSYDATTGALFLQLRTTTVTRTHTFNSTLTAGVWQHVVFTYAGGSNISGASIYINALKNTSTPSGTLSGTMLEGQPFYLGQRSGSFFHSGLMDEVIIFDKELSQAGVTELHNSFVILDPNTHSAVTNMQSNLRMGDGDTFPTITDNDGNDDGTMVNMSAADFVSDVP